MERTAFALLRSMEQSWWYRGRASIVSRLFSRYVHTKGADILDYGAGNGGMYSMLREYGRVFAFEPDAGAREEAGLRGYTQVFSSESEALARPYDVIVACDVLEHLEHDDTALIRAVRALATGGVVIATVPAYQWMWGAHDEQHHHFRRYTRSKVRTLFTDAGLRVVFVSHWNMSLFPAAVLMRLIGTTGEASLQLPSFLNEILFALICFESRLMSVFSLTFGLSVVAVGIKQ